MMVEVKISEIVGEDGGIMTFGFLDWGAEIGMSSRTCGTLYRSVVGMDEVMVEVGMDELLLIIIRRISEGTEVQAELAPKYMGSSAEVSRCSTKAFNFLVILSECFLEVFLFFC